MNTYYRVVWHDRDTGELKYGNWTDFKTAKHKRVQLLDAGHIGVRVENEQNEEVECKNT